MQRRHVIHRHGHVHFSLPTRRLLRSLRLVHHCQQSMLIGSLQGVGWRIQLVLSEKNVSRCFNTRGWFLRFVSPTFFLISPPAAAASGGPSDFRREFSI